jgi:peptide/nickel transport system ATP-binding protein
MTDIMVEARDLTKTFTRSRGLFRRRQPLHAVRGLSLAVLRGEAVALVGESGSGKTTVGNMLVGLEKPTSGDVRLGGAPLASLPRLERARLIQPVFQNPMLALNPRRSIANIIAEPLVVHGLGDAADRERRVSRMMDSTGLPRRLAHARPSQLSGGQRQRVAIARALVLGAEVVVCDEPTSALDVSVQAQILNLLADLRAELGLTLIFITHDLSVVEFLCERMLVMHRGRLVEEGPTEEVLRAPRDAYTRTLLDAVLTVDPEAGLPAAPPEAMPLENGGRSDDAARAGAAS